MIYYNSNKIEEWNFGDENIVKVYRGVKGNPKHNYEEDYLTLVAETDNVSFSYSTAASSNKLKYSLDSGETWNDLSNGQSTSAINSGEKILFKASGLTVNTERGIGKIIPSASASVEGNIMSLAYGDNFSGQTVIPNNFQFRKLFSGVTSITSAENMALPATTVKKQCYSQMFQACTNLTKTPKVIGSSAMTWDGDYCFSDMFNSCTSLTTVPSGLLPAKNLSSACYWCFFQYCSNLTNTPLLPATTLVSNCYLEMFKGCTNLNHIEALFTTTPSSSYMSNWVSGVTNSGTFYKNSEATWTSSCGTSTYPCNWTVENYVPSDNQEEESSDYVGVVVYYKVITSGGTPEYKVCYAVVDDISQYHDTEFVDVFNKADEKWYKLNNLNQYEEYGVYGDSISSGSTSRLPQGYTEVEYVENTTNAYLNLNLYLYDSSSNSYEITTKYYTTYTSGFGYLFSSEGTNSPYNGIILRWNSGRLELEAVPNTNVTSAQTSYDDGTSALTVTCTSTDATNNVPISLFCGIWSTGPWRNGKGRFYTFSAKKNGTIVRDLVPCKRDSDSMVGMYDIVNDVFYYPPNYTSYQLVAGPEVTPTEVTTYYEGKLAIVDGYEYMYSGSSWVNVGEVSGSTIPDNYVIPFEDSNVKALCVNNWGGNVVAGELTYGEAKQVTSLGSVFKNNKSITSFDELAYFKGITAIDNGEFAGCTSLTDIVIPNNVRYLGYNLASRATFSGCTNLSGVTMISGGDSLTTDLTANNGSYYMNSSHSNVPMVFPDREITMSGGTFGYYDYLSIVYFQSSTPPTNLANADINNYRKLANVYCPVGSLSAYEAALTGKGKTISEYDFETDSLGLLDKEKEWASKTSTQTIYPVYYDEKAGPLNDLTFETMADAQAYAYNNCVYDGERATIDGELYIFNSEDENGWVENTHSLPDVPFMLNYNAKNYNSSTYSIAKTEGQLKDVDAVCNYGYGIVDHSSDGYISVTSNTRMLLSGSTYIGRDNTQTGCTMTIVSKVKTSSGYSILTNRRNSGGYMNWMWRYPSNGIFLHGSSSYNNPLYFTTTTSTPIIASIKTYYNNGVKQQLNDWTNNGSYSGNFQYGTVYNGDSSLFCDYTDNNSEFWQGDFYWVYMSQNVLTDEQIQQVIYYNENL